MTDKDDIMIKSCGNVFKDLGFDDEEAENLRIRSLLMIETEHYLKDNGSALNKISERFHLKPSDIENLFRGKTESFTIDMLVNILTYIGLKVNITVQKDVA